MTKAIEDMVRDQVQRSELSRRASLLTSGEARSGPPPVVTVSREYGSGGRLVGKALAEELGWSFWDKELVDAIAKNADVGRYVVESFDEKTLSEIQVLARSIFGNRDFGSFYYHKQLAVAVLAIARHGNAVIVGRGANFLLPKALNVRIEASMDTRIRNAMSYSNVSRSEAIQQIQYNDRERAEFIKRIFGRDIDDHTAYDLTIMMDCFSIRDAVSISLAAVAARYPWVMRVACEVPH